MSEIIININEANKSQKYQSKEELFQIEAFENVSKILFEHKVSGNLNDITECRFHDTIFIDGDRGVGKTAFMVNIENYYNKYFEAKVENIKDKPKYIFLKSVDPTLLEHTEKFLGVILGKIVEIVSKRLKNNGIDEDDYYIDNNCDRKYKNEKASKNCIDGYYNALENLSKSLSAVSSLENKQDVGIEEIASYKSSQKLEQYAHEFFKIVSTMFGVNAIVMLIDDVDMAFDKGFDVLEVVRKYLASPYLIPIVAGDMKLYREIVETRFKEKIQFFQDVKYLKDLNNDLKNSDEYKEKIKLLDNLVEQYLHKIFPNEYKIELKDIFTIIRENLVTVKFLDLDIPFTEIKDFEIRHLNFGINQKQFTFKVFENNTRKLIQYLISKKEIYNNFFKNIDYPKDTKYESYLPQKVISKYDKFIVPFMQTVDYKKSLNITCSILKDEKNNYLVKFLNNDLNSKYLISDELKKLLLVKEQENRYYAIQYKNLKEVIQLKSKYSDIEDYIINLFIYNDYIKESHHQTKNYIYAGKFVELIIYSIFIKEIEEINIKYIENISKKIFENIKKKNLINDYEIYTAIYDKNSDDLEDGSELLEVSKYFNELEININLLELSFIPNSIPFNSNKIDDKSDDKNEIEEEVVIDYKTADLSRVLILWKNIFAKKLMINSTTLYRILDKFYENLSYMKNQKLSDSPLEFLQRVVLIFINSVAYFESTNFRIANTNIAIGERFDLKTALTKTNAATLNIKPLINDEDTLTKALFFHPIISHILFPNEDSKLEYLEFTKDYLINQKDEFFSKENDRLFKDLQSAINVAYLKKNYKDVFVESKKLIDSSVYTEIQKNVALQKMGYAGSRWRTAYDNLTELERSEEIISFIWNKLNNAQK